MPKNALRVGDLRRTVGIIWDASGVLLIAWTAILLLQGVIPVATVWLTKPLVDGLQGAIGAGASSESLRPLFGVAAALAGLLLLGELLSVARQWVGFAQGELVQDHISDLIHAKSAQVDLGFFENAEFLDQLYRVRSDSASRPLALLDGVGSLLQNSVTVLGIGALLLGYSPWIAVVLLLGTLPAFVVVLRANRVQHAWWQETTTDRRRTQYLGDLLTGATSAAEFRLFSLSTHFRSRFNAIRRTLREGRLRMLRRQSLARLMAEGAAVLSSGGTMVWMVWRALKGLASLGDLALFYQAFQRAQALVRVLFGNVNQLYSNALFLGNLFEFLDLPVQVTAQADAIAESPVVSEGVRFVDVTFRYPGSARLALDRFALTIPAGRTVAIVGANGAGKSTLVKLLARFYDPEQGRVEIDGTDIRRFDPEVLRRAMTVMFQSPVPYQETVRDNIAMSDRNAVPTPGRVEAAARDAGAEALVSRLAGGYDALLGKHFPGGTELSGGEWQRIAMARAFYRRSPLVVLDEPTSQMDSWAEAEWFDRFHALTAGVTAVIITHRLSIARRADRIHVMGHGRIQESGTHEELLALGGAYASSWNSTGNGAG